MPEEKFMRLAIEEAKKGDFPFGAVIVKDDEALAKAHNTASEVDPTAHAEINAIREACRELNTTDLDGCTLYATCEPCPMCFTASWWAQISKIVYGAEGDEVPEEDWKIDVSVKYLNEHSGNKIQIESGFLKDECLKLSEEKDQG